MQDCHSLSVPINTYIGMHRDAHNIQSLLNAPACLAQATAITMKQQLDQHRKASATLKANISALENKVTEALSKKETLKARAASAQVSRPVRSPAHIC